MLFATLAIDFGISQIMRIIKVGDAQILSPIIGTVVGWLVLWFAPQSIAGIIVGAVVTIASNLILTYLIYPSLDDKVGDKLEKSTEKFIQKSDNSEYAKALFSPDAETRVKYLCRHMRYKKFYCFNFSADTELAFRAVEEAVCDPEGLANDYPDIKIQSYRYDPSVENPQGHIEFALPNLKIIFISSHGRDEEDIFALGIYKYNDDGMKLKESIAFESNAGHLLDKIYMLASEAIKSVDADCTVEIIPFNLT
jgi:hypothetical protein